MRRLLPVLIVTLVGSTGDPASVAAQAGCSSIRPAPDWVCVNGGWLPPQLAPPPPPPPPMITPQVISVGDEVMFTLDVNSQVSFEVTPPSDGLLVVTISDDPNGFASLAVVIDGTHYYNSATHEVFAGETYLIEVWLANFWDYYGPPLVSFVMTTSVDPRPVESLPQCLTTRPAADWVCVNGGWVPADHPLAFATPANPTPSLPPPAPAQGCTTPDPFAGIPGLVGVCIGNNAWVPLGHPLAGGGGLF